MCKMKDAYRGDCNSSEVLTSNLTCSRIGLTISAKTKAEAGRCSSKMATCSILSQVGIKPVNANPGLKVKTEVLIFLAQIKKFSLLCLEWFEITQAQTEGQTDRNLH